MSGGKQKITSIQKLFNVKSRKKKFHQEELFLGDNLSFTAAEAYRLLRTNVIFAMSEDKPCRIIGITSSCSGEGKSTTALNLANTLAKTGAWVLLIEADMRLPTMYHRLDVGHSPGLSDLLTGKHSAEEVVQESGLHEQLRIITSGDIPTNPSELLGSKQMREMLENYTHDFNFIILNLPPVTEVADALVISKLTDGMIMVVRQDYTNKKVLDEAMQKLQYVQAKMLGFVMTRTDSGSRKRTVDQIRKYLGKNST